MTCGSNYRHGNPRQKYLEFFAAPNVCTCHDYPLETRLSGWNLIGTDTHQGDECSLADTEFRKRTRLGKSESCRCSNQTFS
jgi:hypothetical protein